MVLHVNSTLSLVQKLFRTENNDALTCFFLKQSINSITYILTTVHFGSCLPPFF